jgi:hypothetical protein
MIPNPGLRTTGPEGGLLGLKSAIPPYYWLQQIIWTLMSVPWAPFWRFVARVIVLAYMVKL